MAGTTAGDGGLDDPDRAWRRPAPGHLPESPAAPAATVSATEPTSVWAPGGAADRGDVRWESPAVPAASPRPAGDGVTPAPGWSRGDEPRSPVVGGMEDAPQFGVWGDGPTDPNVAVDERPAAPPAAVGDRVGGWWGRAGVAAAALAVVIAVGAAVSGDGEPDEAATATSAASPTTSTPPSTRRPPRTTAPPAVTTTVPATDATATAAVDPAEDPRVLITQLPEGFEPLGAHHGTDFRFVDGLDGMLFAGDRATPAEGTWARVQPATSVTFLGPTTALKDGERTTRIGTDQRGDDVAVVETGGGTFAVTAHDLPLDVMLAFAGAIAVGADDTWSVRAAAVPPGLLLVAGDLDVPRPVRMTSFSTVNYRGPDGAAAWLTSWLADDEYDPLAMAPFVLSDVSYVTIGGNPGVMGTRNLDGLRAHTVRWRRAGVDIELVATGLDEGTLLALAGEASVRADGRWGERDWQRITDVEPLPESPVTVMVEPELTLGDLGRAPLQVVRLGSSVWWSVDARGSIGRTAELTDAPLMLQVATNPVPGGDPTVESQVVALVLGHDPIEGATLRVRTGVAAGGDGAGAATEVAVHAVAPADPNSTEPDEVFPYGFGAAVAVPWPQGDFVAEVIAPDGITVLASATRADLW